MVGPLTPPASTSSWLGALMSRCLATTSHLHLEAELALGLLWERARD